MSRCPDVPVSMVQPALPNGNEHQRQITGAPSNNGFKRTGVAAYMERRRFAIGLLATLGACIPNTPRIDGAPAAPSGPSALWPVPSKAKEPPPPASAPDAPGTVSSLGTQRAGHAHDRSAHAVAAHHRRHSLLPALRPRRAQRVHRAGKTTRQRGRPHTITRPSTTSSCRSSRRSSRT